jgi:hypothetical protein
MNEAAVIQLRMQMAKETLAQATEWAAQWPELEGHPGVLVIQLCGGPPGCVQGWRPCPCCKGAGGDCAVCDSGMKLCAHCDRGDEAEGPPRTGESA